MRQKTLCSWPVGFRISFCASFNPFRMTKMRKRKREREREKERERESMTKMKKLRLRLSRMNLIQFVKYKVLVGIVNKDYGNKYKAHFICLVWS
jgi:hypothetical protein